MSYSYDLSPAAMFEDRCGQFVSFPKGALKCTAFHGR
jgi:hypothetical protein